jgi:exonuclease SbcC
LGRLLELYEKSPKDGEAPLTEFVKDLLGIDELDAVMEGLHPVGDKRLGVDISTGPTIDA